MSDYVMWCTACGLRLTAEQARDAKCCPSCGTHSLPCDPKYDFQIEINWHELRILGIWAANYAGSLKDDDARASLRGILGRLERQAPDATPLTLGGEVRQLRKAVANGEIKATGIETHGIPPEGVVQVAGPGAVGFARRPTVAPPDLDAARLSNRLATAVAALRAERDRHRANTQKTEVAVMTLILDAAERAAAIDNVLGSIGRT